MCFHNQGPFCPAVSYDTLRLPLTPSKLAILCSISDNTHFRDSHSNKNINNNSNRNANSNSVGNSDSDSNNDSEINSNSHSNSDSKTNNNRSRNNNHFRAAFFLSQCCQAIQSNGVSCSLCSRHCAARAPGTSALGKQCPVKVTLCILNAKTVTYHNGVDMCVSCCCTAVACQ